MGFQKMCPQFGKYGKDCGTAHNMNIFDIYRILAVSAALLPAWKSSNWKRKSNEDLYS